MTEQANGRQQDGNMSSAQEVKGMRPGRRQDGGPLGQDPEGLRRARAHGRERNHFSPEEKVSVIRRHLVDKVPVSDLCDQLGLNPNVFYRWMKEFWESAPTAFRRKSDKPARRLDEKVQRLQDKLAYKDGVIAELASENLALKKTPGDL